MVTVTAVPIHTTMTAAPNDAVHIEETTNILRHVIDLSRMIDANIQEEMKKQMSPFMKTSQIVTLAPTTGDLIFSETTIDGNTIVILP